MRTGADEAQYPKYAHIERERRWLVDSRLRPDLSQTPYVLIEDRYITGTRLRLRRMTDSVSGDASLKLTKKYEADDPLARPIVTAYLSEEEFAVFGAMPGTVLIKRRYNVDGFSVDCFDGSLSGLELAEIEWADDHGLRAVSPPLWAIREVSHDPEYQGGALVTNGLPTPG
jgi:CYTH domain-containing protein